MRHLSWALCLLAAFGVFAQQGPAFERGLHADKLYQFNGIDNVNLVNGNVSIVLPIGMSYAIDGDLSYQLTLSYNSKLWDHVSSSSWVHAYPSRRSNAGVGWLLGFGRFVGWDDPSNGAEVDLYESPDGSEHLFFGTAPTYTNDGSNLRARYESGSVVAVDFPNGVVQRHFKVNGRYELREIHAPRGSGQMVINPEATRPSQCDASTTSWWRVSDTEGTPPRGHYLCFKDYNMDDVMKPMVESVALVGPQGQTMTYGFLYETVTNIPRTAMEFDPSTTQPWRNFHTATFLKKVTLPDGSFYEFEHAPNSAEVTAIVLPTKARIEYQYASIGYPFENICQGPFDPDMGLSAISTGVIKRTVVAPATAGRPPARHEWTYTYQFRALNSSAPNYDAGYPGGAYRSVTLCPDQFNIPTSASLWDELVVSVRDRNPDAPPGEIDNGTRVDSHFSVWPGDQGLASDTSPAGFKRRYHGFPYGKYDPTQDRYLSQETYQCANSGCTKLRSTYVRHDIDPMSGTSEHDIARWHRLASTRTFFHDDPAGCTADSSGTRCKSITSGSVDWDGYGHYRVITDSNDLVGTQSRTVTTDWNKVNGVPRQIQPGDRWFTEEYENIAANEQQRIAAAQACFATDASGGRYLRATRTLKGSSPGANDLITLNTLGSDANLASETYYGGDTTPLPSGAATATNLCNAIGSLGTAAYEILHTWQDGVQATSQHAGTTFKSLELTIDRSGAVTMSKDTAEVPTSYNYDSAGRITSIVPTGAASTVYTYGNALLDANGALAQPAYATQTTGSGTTAIESVFQFDALGRVWREKKRMPDGTWSVRETLYDGLNRQIAVSELEQLTGSEFQFVPAAKTTYEGYDPFGRVGVITAPDQSKSRFAYIGSREIKRYVTDPGGAEKLRSTEVYDGFERLRSVIERPDASGDVTAGYGYDVGGRLVSVKMTGATGVVQQRVFDYDGRGFLRWESQPESAMTSYTYDARGHVKSKEQSAAQSIFDLRYSYDAGERLWKVEGRNPFFGQSGQLEFRVMKESAFGTANGTVVRYGVSKTDLRKGKLTTATRYNYDDWGGGPVYKIEDTLYYLDDAGRKTDRSTAIIKDGDTIKTVDLTVAYDDQGLETTIKYPTCSGCGVPASDPDRTLTTRTYQRGRLKSISGFLNDVSYWPNGMKNVLVHGNLVADTQVVGNMPRPSSIGFATWDRCVRPTFTQQPAGATKPSGGSVTLSVNVTGTGPFEYQWFDVTGNAFLQNTQSISVSPSVTSDYYVIVSGQCGYETSQTARVTVSGCAPPETGAIQTVVQPDGSWILRPNPIARSPRIYTWRRVSDNSVVGNGETLAVGVLPTTTTFSLTIQDECGTVTSNVTLQVPVLMPAGLTAQWTSGTQIQVGWPTVNGATYVVERRSGSTWSEVATTSGASYIDNSVSPSTTYAYRVAAVLGGAKTNYTNADVATTRAFQAAVPGGSFSAAVSADMLNAVNSVRAAAGWPSVTWSNILAATDPIVSPGNNIMARHITSCRERMNEALHALGVPVLPWTDADMPVTVIKAVHVNEIQGRAQ